MNDNEQIRLVDEIRERFLLQQDFIGLMIADALKSKIVGEPPRHSVTHLNKGDIYS